MAVWKGSGLGLWSQNFVVPPERPPKTMSKGEEEANASEWWLTNETSGRCEIYLASLAIKQSTLVRHAFEVPLYRFVVKWHPLPSHAQVIEFRIVEWDELDPKTLENRGESENLAGLLSWTINASTGALLTVLSGPLADSRIKKFCSACEEVHMKLSRQEMLALFVDYAQEAAQQVVRQERLAKFLYLEPLISI